MGETWLVLDSWSHSFERGVRGQRPPAFRVDAPWGSREATIPLVVAGELDVAALPPAPQNIAQIKSVV
jgi:hypothetical protein